MTLQIKLLLDFLFSYIAHFSIYLLCNISIKKWNVESKVVITKYKWIFFHRNTKSQNEEICLFEQHLNIQLDLLFVFQIATNLVIIGFFLFFASDVDEADSFFVNVMVYSILLHCAYFIRHSTFYLPFHFSKYQKWATKKIDLSSKFLS